MWKYIAHRDCGEAVTFDPNDISLGAEDLEYYAACLTCDIDLYQFETVEILAEG